jgi:hypothetical protein
VFAVAAVAGALQLILFPQPVGSDLAILLLLYTLAAYRPRRGSIAGLTVCMIGAETAMQALSSSSIVAMSYGPEEQPIGALAVIGPMRMNYAKVMSVVDFTADTVSQLLAELTHGKS